MWNDFGRAGALFLFLILLPLAAWLGAVLTRGDRPLGRFVDRWFRFLVLGLLGVSALCQHGGLGFLNPWADTVDLVALFLVAMLFIPMLRRLQDKTEQQQAEASIPPKKAAEPQGSGGSNSPDASIT